LLIVDDTPSNLHLLTAMLTERGYRVKGAPNGKLALMSARAQPPDLILLDVVMPDLDGFEVCEKLKESPNTRDIPIIFLSGMTDPDVKVKGFALGGVDYVTKPFHAEEVLSRVRTHLTLRNLQKNLEQQVAELDSFSHTVAHDLKNPLGALLGYAEIVEEELEGTDNDDLRASAAAIRKLGHKMVTIVDGLLLLACVRKMDVASKEILDMDAVVAGAKQRLVGLIAENEAKLVLPSEWPSALGWAPWVEEVWTNFISNAIKYGGDSPVVELGADMIEHAPVANRGDEEEAFARFWVRDHGPGIAPENQRTLFTEFSRLHSVAIEGHGLGLSIVRRIVDKLGGSVGVESTVGDGCLFYFTLPAATEARR